LQLFTEAFVSDELWLQSVKAFTASIFLADLITPLLSKYLQPYAMQSLEDIRHVKLVNFDESKFMEVVVATGDP